MNNTKTTQIIATASAPFDDEEFKISKLDSEALWLLSGLVICAILIVGCALCSLRITKVRVKYRMEREKQSTTLAFDESHRVEMSMDIDNPSSIDLTSSSAK